MRQLALGAGLVHGRRQLLRKHLRKLIDGNIETGGQLLDGFAAKHLLQLFRRDRQVLTVSNPGFDLIAQARLLQFCDNRAQPTLLPATEHFAQDNRNDCCLKLAECSLEREMANPFANVLASSSNSGCLRRPRQGSIASPLPYWIASVSNLSMMMVSASARRVHS